MKYSIITINYNNRDGLRRTIESVINQTYKDFEYIIIDGGSTDGSVDVIKEYADKIDYWVSEPDKGIYNAMNKGILQAHGEYLNFMNSGDCFYDIDVLESMCKYLGQDIVAGKFIFGNHKNPWGLEHENITFLDLYRNTLCHQSTFIKSRLFTNGLYDEKFTIVSDWKFFIDKLIKENCSFKNTDIIVALYDTDGISAKQLEKLAAERNDIIKQFMYQRILDDYEKFINANYCIHLLNQLSGSYRFQKIVCILLKTLIKIKKYIK